MKISVEVSEANEGTDSPWWVILDPHQNTRLSTACLSRQVTGPFFSREEAERELNGRRYNYGKNAVVYCMSGYNSGQYALAHHVARTTK